MPTKTKVGFSDLTFCKDQGLVKLAEVWIPSYTKQIESSALFCGYSLDEIELWAKFCNNPVIDENGIVKHPISLEYFHANDRYHSLTELLNSLKFTLPDQEYGFDFKNGLIFNLKKVRRLETWFLSARSVVFLEGYY